MARHGSERRRNSALAIAGVLFGMLLAYAVVADGLANRMARTYPELSLGLRPSHTRALETLANRVAEEDVPAAGRIARQVLARDLSSAVAARVVATSMVGKNEGNAARLFVAAEGLSRRDLPTQLYFIEAQVQRGDVAGALRHFDIAMRTSRAGRTMLNPVLCSATLDPALTSPIAAVLNTAPDWADDFVGYCADQTDARTGLARVLTEAPRSHRVVSDAVLAKIVYLTAQAGEIDVSYRLYASLVHDAGRPLPTLLSDPTFTHAASMPPFDWQYVINPDLGAQQDGEGIPGLSIHANGQSGSVASQLLRVAPGRYRLDARGGSDTPGRIVVTLACADGSRSLGSVALPMPGSRRSGTDLAVPDGCPAQWLRISAETLGQPFDGRLDAVTLRRTG